MTNLIGALFDAGCFVSRFLATLLLFRLVAGRGLALHFHSLFTELRETVLTRFETVRELGLCIVNHLLGGELFDVGMSEVCTGEVNVFHLRVSVDLHVLHVGIEEGDVVELGTGEVCTGQVGEVIACTANCRIREVGLGQVSIVENVLKDVGTVKDSLLHNRTAEDALACFAIEEGSLVHLGLFERALGDDALIEDDAGEVLAVEVHILQVGLGEGSLLELSLGKIHIVKVGQGEVSALEVHVDELGTAEVSLGKTSLGKVHVAEFHAAEIGVDQVASRKVRLDDDSVIELCRTHEGTGEVRVGQVSVAEIGHGQVDIDEGCVLEVCLAKVSLVGNLHCVQTSAFEVSLRETGIQESRTVEVCVLQVGFLKVGTTEVCTGKNGCFEVSFAEVRVVHHGVLELHAAEVRATETDRVVRCIGTGKVRNILNGLCIFKVESIDVFAAERNVDILAAPVGLLSECASGHGGEQQDTELGCQIEVHIHSIYPFVRVQSKFTLHLK